jgi:hypothetical protein
MDNVTASGLTPLALASITLGVVTAVTLIVVVVGLLIDRSAARHERAKGR